MLPKRTEHIFRLNSNCSIVAVTGGKVFIFETLRSIGEVVRYDILSVDLPCVIWDKILPMVALANNRLLWTYPAPVKGNVLSD